MNLRVAVACLLLPVSFAAAQSQRDMNERAARGAHRSDSTMNVLYKRLEAKYRSDSVALRKLQVAQRAWVAYRDAQVDATYPAVDLRVYGSVLPMCVSFMIDELTKDRIAQLRYALRPTEGDVCAGGPG